MTNKNYAAVMNRRKGLNYRTVDINRSKSVEIWLNRLGQAVLPSVVRVL